ncbi:MAG: glycosyltransferase family 9 protein [Planctomycetes bacterium]|nr:glycosyltransferase family 9 protein [Planctomycetota bacterium]
MNVSSMRRMERWLGIPLCLALTLYRRLADMVRRLRPAPPPRASSSVLLVKLAEMGSTVLAQPAIRRLQQLYPGLRLHYVCLHGNEKVLELFPHLDIQAHTIRTSSKWHLISDSVRVVRKLRRERVDVAISLEVFSRAAAALIYLCRVPIRVGFHRFHSEGCNCGDLYTHRVQFNPYLHMSAGFLMLAEASHRPTTEVPLLKQKIDVPRGVEPMPVEEADRLAVLDKLVAQGYPKENQPPILILNANSSDLFPLRRWPRERYEELARRCLDVHQDLWIVLTGAPDEAQGIEQLARRLDHPRVIVMAGRTTLRELVVLFGLAKVLISNDSGPAQFAALASVHIISLFGPETPLLYAPLSERNRSLTAGLSCSPCINAFNQRHSPCNDNRCLQALTVEDVFAAFERAYAEAGSARSSAET